MRIRPFLRSDQSQSQAVILLGLAERFETLDPALNHDLEDIWFYYVSNGSCFVVAEDDGQIIGTGGLIAEGDSEGRLVRISVAADRRRQGIGRAISEHLIAIARSLGFLRLRVETNDNWKSAINLYLQLGFVETDRRDGETHFQLHLVDTSY